jgi:hypothetical protein
MATQRYRRNNISQLILPNGSEVSEHADKEATIFHAFKERLGTTSTPPMLFDSDSLISPTEGLEELSLPFTKDEIDLVVKEMPPDKAPGPNGFSEYFLKVLGILSRRIFTDYALTFGRATWILRA